MRTLTADITVRQKMTCFWIIELFRCLLDELTLVIEFAEIIRRKLMVNLTRRTRIDIKRDTKTLKTGLNQFVVTVHHLLRGDSLFASTDSDRHSVFITAAYKKHITAFQA